MEEVEPDIICIIGLMIQTYHDWLNFLLASPVIASACKPGKNNRRIRMYVDIYHPERRSRVLYVRGKYFSGTYSMATCKFTISLLPSLEGVIYTDAYATFNNMNSLEPFDIEYDIEDKNIFIDYDRGSMFWDHHAPNPFDDSVCIINPRDDGDFRGMVCIPKGPQLDEFKQELYYLGEKVCFHLDYIRDE